MKRQLLYLLLLLSGTLHAQIVNIPDENFKEFLLWTEPGICDQEEDTGYAVNSLGECIYIDANDDDEIDMAEAAEVWELIFPDTNPGWSGIDSFEGLEAFVNLRVIKIRYLDFSSIDLSALTNLEEIYFRTDELASLDCSALINLEYLECDCENLASLSVANLPNLKTLNIKGSYDSPIPLNLDGLVSLENLDCSYTTLHQLDCTGLVSLKKVNSEFCPELTSVNISGLENLEEVHLQGCTSLSTFNFEGSNNIKEIDLRDSEALTIPSDFTDIEALEILNVSNSNILSLNVSGLASLKELYCDHTLFTQLDVAGLGSLEKLSCRESSLESLDASEATNLTELDCYRAIDLASLVVDDLTNLTDLTCVDCPITTLNVSGLENLESLNLQETSIESLDVTGLENMEVLNTSSCSALSSLILGNLPNLHTFEFLSCSLLEEMDCSGLSDLDVLLFKDCSALKTVILNDMPALEELLFSSSGDGSPLLTTLQIGNMPLLHKVRMFYCSSLESLDLSGCPSLNSLHLQSAENLSYLNLKNGSNGYIHFDIDTALNHPYICIDEDEQFYVYESLSPDEAYVSTFCPSGPVNNYNTIEGSLTFDDGGGNCEVLTYTGDFVKLGITGEMNTGATFTNPGGEYLFYVGAGSYDIFPLFENDWFTVTPASATLTFPAEDASSQTQDFCITANGSHPDAEINIVTLEPAQPGMDASYKIIYKNKGNTTLSGSLYISYLDNVTDLVSADPPQDATSPGMLGWNFNDLLPFEQRSINVIFNVNGPMETPAVNIDDILTYTVGLASGDDETPQDNQFTYNEVVIGSFDPNDIICLEGETASPELIGDYLHYNINFENTGTAPATIVNVVQVVDESLFDINTLQVINTSHDAIIRIEGNAAQYLFEDIGLEPLEKGNIAFKIKTRESLETGDSVMQKASIYFDYNWPIITNEAVTTFEVLTGTNDLKPDNSTKVYPNPIRDVVNISSLHQIKSAYLFDINGRLLQITLLDHTNATLDMTSKTAGVYFLKIFTEMGVKIEKIIKQ